MTYLLQQMHPARLYSTGQKNCAKLSKELRGVIILHAHFGTYIDYY